MNSCKNLLVLLFINFLSIKLTQGSIQSEINLNKNFVEGINFLNIENIDFYNDELNLKNINKIEFKNGKIIYGEELSDKKNKKINKQLQVILMSKGIDGGGG